MKVLAIVGKSISWAVHPFLLNIMLWYPKIVRENYGTFWTIKVYNNWKNKQENLYIKNLQTLDNI